MTSKNGNRLLPVMAIAAALGMTVSPNALAQTKFYKSVPSADQLSQDLFGHKGPAMRTRSIGAAQSVRTRGIRWHEEQVEAEAAAQAVESIPAVAGDTLSTKTVQTAGLDHAAPVPEKLAFNIQFHFDSTEMMAHSQIYIDRLGEVLNTPENRGNALMIVGHTDSSGSDSYNWQLSMKRATAIRDYLVQAWNVDASTLTIDARGEYEPIDGLDPRDPVNRRVEFWALNG